MSELKSVCVDRAIPVSGDKRAKASYVNAIFTFKEHQQELAAIPTAVIADPFDEPMTKGSAFGNRTPDTRTCSDSARRTLHERV